MKKILLLVPVVSIAVLITAECRSPALTMSAWQHGRGGSICRDVQADISLITLDLAYGDMSAAADNGGRLDDDAGKGAAAAPPGPAATLYVIAMNDYTAAGNSLYSSEQADYHKQVAEGNSAMRKEKC